MTLTLGAGRGWAGIALSVSPPTTHRSRGYRLGDLKSDCRLRLGLAAIGLAAAIPVYGQITQLYSEKKNEPEAGDFVVQHVRTDALQFGFVAPAGWEVRPDGTNTALLLTAPDLSAGIRLGLGSTTNAPPAKPEAQSCREQVLGRIPGAQLLREFPCFVDGQQGVCYDLARVVGRSTQAVFRIAFVPYPGGMAEFELRTSTNHFPRARTAFRQVLETFRIESPPRPGDSAPARPARPR